MSYKSSFKSPERSPSDEEVGMHKRSSEVAHAVYFMDLAVRYGYLEPTVVVQEPVLQVPLEPVNAPTTKIQEAYQAVYAIHNPENK